jgi:uncharacterized protein (DUF4415 family)
MSNTQTKFRDAAKRAKKSLKTMTDEDDAAATAAAKDENADAELVEADDRRVSPRARAAAEKYGIGTVVVRSRGRPRMEHPKENVSMRLDADLLDALRTSGPGWQTRANDMLRKAVGL